MRESDDTEFTCSPLHVLHLVSTFEVKTDTKWLVRLARHLHGGAVRMSAACFHRDGPIREQLNALGIETHNLAVRDPRDPRAILRARRLMKRLGCDIVHTHLLRADLLGGMAARLARVPVVLSTAYALGDYRRSVRRRSDRMLDAGTAALPTHVVAVSNAVRRDCIARLGLDETDITVIHTAIDPPNHVDPTAITDFRRTHATDGKRLLVVTTARLSYEKGLDTLVNAAAVLNRTHPAARIVVVGEGPDRAAIESAIETRRLRGAMILPGFLEDVWPALFAADVVCLPSRSEGMPNALLEAMAAGRPVVAARVGGVPEAVTHERDGLLVRPDDPAALAAAIGRLLDDVALRERFGQAAKRTVTSRFDVREAAMRYATLYKTLLSRRRTGRVRALQLN
ncbi:MAG: glycosyltransferase [Phycisphaerae bacterium]